jgi:hypothetical protein
VKCLRLGCLATLSLVALGSAESAVGQTDARPVGRDDAPISFNIPAQPLTHALDAYSATTGLMVLYDSHLAEERRSTAVSGELAPDVAIRVLLEGTGLAVFSAGRAFGIEVELSDPQSGTGDFKAADMPYLALVQRTIQRVFCEREKTKPGQYRAALQFRIGAAGEIMSPDLLSSTGDRQRDLMIVEALGRLRVPLNPPPGMAQPLSMIISPRPLAQSGDCGFSDHR